MNTNKTQAEQLPQDAVMQSVLKENDLRIGNKIFFIICDREDSKLDEKKEITVDISDFEFIRDNNSLFEGIPLTEEWLQKLGFELKGFYRLKVTSFLELCWKPHDNTLNLQTEKNGFTEDSNCKYVHQLQNLYFALTGSELTVA